MKLHVWQVQYVCGGRAVAEGPRKTRDKLFRLCGRGVRLHLHPLNLNVGALYPELAIHDCY